MQAETLHYTLRLCDCDGATDVVCSTLEIMCERSFYQRLPTSCHWKFPGPSSELVKGGKYLLLLYLYNFHLFRMQVRWANPCSRRRSCDSHTKGIHLIGTPFVLVVSTLLKSIEFLTYLLDTQLLVHHASLCLLFFLKPQNLE